MERTSESTDRDWARRIAQNTLGRVQSERRRRTDHAAQARATAERLAAQLAAEPGVRRVILFGSLAGPGAVIHERSDIDLAVEGLGAEREAQVAFCLHEFATVPFDLVRLEAASPSLRARIEETGEVLFVAG